MTTVSCRLASMRTSPAPPLPRATDQLPAFVPTSFLMHRTSQLPVLFHSTPAPPLLVLTQSG